MRGGSEEWVEKKNRRGVQRGGDPAVAGVGGLWDEGWRRGGKSY